MDDLDVPTSRVPACSSCPLAREARQPTWMPTSPPGRNEDLHREAAIAQTEVGLLMRIKTRATLNQDDPGVPAASPYINIINQQAKIMLKAASELGFTPVSRPRVYGGPSVQAPHFDSGSNEEEDPDHVSLEDYLASAPKPPVIN